jgi:hypothetical protein
MVEKKRTPENMQVHVVDATILLSVSSFFENGLVWWYIAKTLQQSKSKQTKKNQSFFV